MVRNARAHPALRMPRVRGVTVLQPVVPADAAAALADAAHAVAGAALRAGLALLGVVAATDCVIALAGGAGPETALEGLAMTALALGGIVRGDVAGRLLRPAGRAALLAALFALAGALDWGVQSHFAQVGSAIVCISAVVSAPRWVALCLLVSVAGYLGDVALHGHSLAWMLGVGGTAVATQLVDLAANGVVGLVLIALVKRFLAGAEASLGMVRGGGESLTPQLAAAARERSTPVLERPDPRTLLQSLTPSERQVLALLAGGALPKQAAGELSVGLATVRSHIAAAKRKTGARTLDQLVALFAEVDGVA